MEGETLLESMEKPRRPPEQLQDDARATSCLGGNWLFRLF